MTHHWDEFSKSLAEKSVPRRESLRLLGAAMMGALLSPLRVRTAWAGRPDLCTSFSISAQSHEGQTASHPVERATTTRAACVGIAGAATVAATAASPAAAAIAPIWPMTSITAAPAARRATTPVPTRMARVLTGSASTGASQAQSSATRGRFLRLRLSRFRMVRHRLRPVRNKSGR